VITRKLKDHPYLLLNLAVLFWAGNFILGRAFHSDIPPVALAFWRWIGAALVITGPALKFLRQDLPVLLKHWQVIFLLSALGIAAFNILVYSGLQYTQAINAFLIQSLLPVLIVAFSFLFFSEKICRAQAAGILISLCGAVMIITHGDFETVTTLRFNKGELMIMTAVLCYAGYSVTLSKRPPVHPLSLIAATFWIGSVIILPFFVWETLYVRTLQPDTSTVLVVCYVAIFPSILSYLCFNRGVELIGPNRAGTFIHLMPVYGSLMSIAILGEKFFWYHAIGIGLIVSGLYLASRKKRH